MAQGEIDSLKMFLASSHNERNAEDEALDERLKGPACPHPDFRLVCELGGQPGVAMVRFLRAPSPPLPSPPLPHFFRSFFLLPPPPPPPPLRALHRLIEPKMYMEDKKSSAKASDVRVDQHMLLWLARRLHEGLLLRFELRFAHLSIVVFLVFFFFW